MKECPACRRCFADEVEVCNQDNEPTRPTLRIDPLINARYQLLRRVGNSSVSVVYAAIDLLSQTEHGVKLILPEFIGEDRKTAERFISEATAPALLNHPNIVRITDSGLLNGFLPFLVMDFIKGATLHDALANGPLTPTRALEFVSAIGNTLDAVHQRQIVHGDLKPRSILIEHDGPIEDAIKITDFGMSSIKSGKLQRSGAAKLSNVLRSPLYLAPEEFSEEASDYRSDIYSLGVMLYEMLVGEVPFRGQSIPSIMKRHLLDTPPAIAGRAPGVTAEIERVVMHALEKDPARRPRSMAEFVEEFEAAVRANENQAGKAVDLDQTIVLAKPPRNSVNTRREDDEGNRNFIQREEPAHGDETDFDATILPGMMRFARVEDDAVTSAAVDDQAEPVWEENAEPAGEFTEDDPPPRSVSPLLLGAGVLVFTLLIALGIYYSRSMQ